MMNANGRMAVGVTKSNHLLLVATRKPVYLSALARALKQIGAYNAINLDGGSSIGLYFKGRTLIQPQRKLTNLLLVYDDREKYERVRDRLASGAKRVAAAPSKPIAFGQSAR